MAAPEIQFWFEFGSNYSYLSVMRIEDGARRLGVRVVGVEPCYLELINAGVTPAVPLAERAYGLRDFRIVDPGGNELSFGEPAIRWVAVP